MTPDEVIVAGILITSLLMMLVMPLAAWEFFRLCDRLSKPHNTGSVSPHAKRKTNQ